MIIVNTTDTVLAAIGNANSHSLSQLYSGWARFSSSINGGSGGSVLNLIQREPTSGTYNTFEWQVIRSRDSLYGNSQELNVPAPGTGSYQCFTPPAAPKTYSFPTYSGTCQNPLLEPGMASTGTSSGTRTRAIGTSEMIGAVTGVTDGVGYAFWGMGSFIGKTGIKYLTLDGVDPLYATNQTLGAFPSSCSGVGTSTISCTYSGGTWPLPTFANIVNGGYRAWSILRAIHDQAPPAYQTTTLTGTYSIDGLIQAAQDQAYQTSTVTPRIPDFVPYLVCNSGSTAATCAASAYTFNLPVFRSHAGQSGAYPNNGINLNPPTATTNAGLSQLTGLPESGSDFNGAVVPVAAESSYVSYGGPSYEAEYYNINQ